MQKGGICRKEESRTDSSQRGMKDRRQERICMKEERSTGWRQGRFSGRRNEVPEIGGNMEAGGMKD
jgi:hypothetical protein